MSRLSNITGDLSTTALGASGGGIGILAASNAQSDREFWLYVGLSVVQLILGALAGKK